MRFLKFNPFALLLFLLPFATVAQSNDSLYARRMATLGNVGVAYNPVVAQYINTMLRTPQATAEAIGRFVYYKPIIDSTLSAYGLPQHIGFMVLGSSMANCAYNDDEGFSGPWAMAYNVGRLWDLKMNTYVDERRDIKKSSAAAAKYFKELQQLYNVTPLAMAAFATTTTTVNKYIRLGGNKFDYWAMYDSLPAPARKIVPSYLAAIYIYNFHSEHGITPKTYQPVSYDTVTVTKWQSFDELAASLHTTPQILRELNPEFKQGIVPLSPRPYVVKLPAKSRQWFGAVDSGNYKPYRMNSYMEEIPELENKNLPIRKATDTAATTQAANVKNTGAGSDTITHIVKRGEGLGIIAQKYKVKVDDIKKWNKLKGYNIYPNQKLIIIRKD